MTVLPQTKEFAVGHVTVGGFGLFPNMELPRIIADPDEMSNPANVAFTDETLFVLIVLDVMERSDPRSIQSVNKVASTNAAVPNVALLSVIRVAASEAQLSQRMYEIRAAGRTLYNAMRLPQITPGRDSDMDGQDGALGRPYDATFLVMLVTPTVVTETCEREMLRVFRTLTRLETTLPKRRVPENSDTPAALRFSNSMVLLNIDEGVSGVCAVELKSTPRENLTFTAANSLLF